MEKECPYENDGNHLGYCNDCGEEGLLSDQCCDNGEMVPNDDCICTDI